MAQRLQEVDGPTHCASEEEKLGVREGAYILPQEGEIADRRKV
jgi:hypothetical protein